jgi:putative oxidoreductase
MLGFGFAAHGYAKLSRGPHAFATVLGALGIPLPSVMAWVTTLLELVGGISIMAGAFIIPLSIPLGMVMLTAMFTVHLPNGFSSIKLRAIHASGAEFGAPGYEMNLLYLAGLLTLVLGGPAISLRDVIRRPGGQSRSEGEHEVLCQRADRRSCKPARRRARSCSRPSRSRPSRRTHSA